MDPQVSGFNRRLHIYHNRGPDGSGGALLREERESASNGDWIGFVGPTQSDLRGTHDIAVFDVDGDSLDDVLISRQAGTVVWRREPHCQEDLGFGSGGVVLEVCGNKLAPGNQAELRLSGAQPNSLALLWVSLSAIPVFIPEIQGTLVALPPLLISTMQTDANGEIVIPITGGNNGPLSLVVQFTVANGLPTLFTPSNGVQIEMLGQ